MEVDKKYSIFGDICNLWVTLMLRRKGSVIDCLIEYYKLLYKKNEKEIPLFNCLHYSIDCIL